MNYHLGLLGRVTVLCFGSTPMFQNIASIFRNVAEQPKTPCPHSFRCDYLFQRVHMTTRSITTWIIFSLFKFLTKIVNKSS